MYKDDFFKGEPLCKIGDCEFWGKQIITPELAKEILQSRGFSFFSAAGVKVDTKAFRDSLIQQVRAWMVGRH